MSEFLPFMSIAASAGSGKTFQLAHRVLRLLAMTGEPDRIGAYTFSRKAAGEIFDEIVKYLRLAAEDASKAAETSAHIGMPRSSGEFEQDLRLLFQHLHRLRIGTLDSRISQMVSAASVELGLPPEFSVMDSLSSEYQRLQNRVLNRLFQGAQLREEDADTFLQLFTEATHGKAEKDFQRQMETFLADYRMTFLTHPQPGRWNGPELQDSLYILEPTVREELAETIRSGLPEVVSDKRIRTALEKIVDACAAYAPGSTWSNDAPRGTLWEQWVKEPSPEVTMYRKTISLPSDIWEPLSQLIHHPFAVALDETIRRTRAVYGFLLTYDYAYRKDILPGGMLAFEDACTLISGFTGLNPDEMAYRLDGEIDHWLLDEFQDTNQLQWNVLEPFISEILQDPEKRRSFFYVGDVKQAIYAWRGGDASLFHRIQDIWPGIEEIAKDHSFRSAQPVLDLVNRIFGEINPGEHLNPEAVEQWNQVFSNHESQRTDLTGHARVVQCIDKDTDMHEVVLDMVKEIPAGREIAILTRTNTEGKEYADTLRSAGLPVSLEGSATVRDDTAVEAVLAMLKLAAHPGDTFSRTLGSLAGLTPRPDSVLKAVHASGVTPVVRSIISELPLQKDAAFSRSRLQRLTRLALEFDQLGEPSIDRFIDYVDHAQIKEHEAGGVIRIMTIHQSKGLGFDAVIVPIKASASFCKVTTGEPVAGRKPDGTPFVSILPPKQVCTFIPEYRDLYHRMEQQSTYENLCTLYVALTRAKQSLQIVLPAPPKTSSDNVRVIGNFIEHRLSTPDSTTASPIQGVTLLADEGVPDWFRQSDIKPPARTEPSPFLLQLGPPIIPRLEPSREGQKEESLEQLFTFFEEDGRELGTNVHEVLSRLQWADDPDHPDLIDPDTDPEVSRHIRHALSLNELRKPEGATDVWREQKFESVLPEGWITGVFDRVVLFPDKAWIQDFKTNKNTGPETVDHYRPQMDLYRTVLSDMLSLDEEQIDCQLLFTSTGEVVSV